MLTENVDVVAPIEREIRLLAHGLAAVKDEQEYIVVREKTHRNTAESTNDRVKWWSVLQAVVLFAVVGWQVYYLKVSSNFVIRRHILKLFNLTVLLRSQTCHMIIQVVLIAQCGFILDEPSVTAVHDVLCLTKVVVYAPKSSPDFRYG